MDACMCVSANCVPSGSLHTYLTLAGTGCAAEKRALDEAIAAKKPPHVIEAARDVLRKKKRKVSKQRSSAGA